MGCYGIGVTRLLASTIEVLSTQEEIRWPLPIAPYLLAFLPPKQGSKEEESQGMTLANKLNSFLIDNFSKYLLVDDRTDLTIGRRLKDIKKLGIPYAVVCGKLLADEVPKVELIDVYNNSTTVLDPLHVFRHIYDLKSSWKFLS
jgi:prolyl-tRNA synthetase